MADGIWRTVGGRRIFIEEGTTLQQAMKKSGKFSKTKENKDSRLKQLNKELDEAKGLLARGKIREEIESIEKGYDSVEEYRKDKKAKQEENVANLEKSKQEKLEKQQQKQEEIAKKTEQIKKDVESSTDLQNSQYEIIKENNPMLDDYHVGIRSPKDIKTFAETLDDDESFVWGDFTRDDAELAVKNNEITIYSSYPIKQGTFVTPSKVQAQEYAGGKGGQIYSKTISLDEVAWINGDEGQFASTKKNRES